MKNKGHHLQYLREMTAELAKMARTDGFKQLAYFLEMASLEAEDTNEKSRNVERV